MRKSLVVLSAAVVALAAACGSSSKGADSGGGETRKVPVKITSKGCEPATLELAPGAATFEVENDGADSITEFELMQGDRIIGETENLTPGLSGDFTVTLKTGEYETKCPGGDSGKITVTAETSGSTAPVDASAAAAVASYKEYVSEQTELLVGETTEFVEAVKAGDVAKAKEEFPKARAPYEAVEPIAESFGDLDPDIDAREGDVPAAEWGGFHRIEKQLWLNGDTFASYTTLSKADTKALAEKVDALADELAKIAPTLVS